PNGGLDDLAEGHPPADAPKAPSARVESQACENRSWLESIQKNVLLLQHMLYNPTPLLSPKKTGPTIPTACYGRGSVNTFAVAPPAPLEFFAESATGSAEMSIRVG
ncbi:unnamed protein product, partial [marine sediment metagenome]